MTDRRSNPLPGTTGLGNKHKPSKKQRELVNSLATAGLGQNMIAKVIGIDRTTMTHYYRKELNVGIANVVMEMGNVLADKARKGDTASLIFFLKTKGRWSETVKQEISGVNGGAIENKWSVEFINATAKD